MKKLSLILFSLVTLAFTLTASFLETLDISKETAEWGIWNSFSDGAYGGPTSKTWHQLSVSTQVALVKEIGAFAKSYTRSEDFKKRYSEYRDTRKPNAPEPFTGVEGMRKLQRESLTKSIQEGKASLKNASGDYRKGMEEGIKAMEAQLKEVDNPNNPMFSKEMNDMLRQNWEQENRDYQVGLAAWEEQYPVSPDAMIKMRLKYFLELSATVDFNAKLTKGPYDKMVFVNKEYESKSADWKLIYRSGKESVEAARAVAREWLGGMK